jgi:hypothetical protein
VKTKGTVTFRPRSGAVNPAALQYLTPEQHVTLCRRLFSKELNYKDIVKKLRDELGIQTYPAALSRFYKAHVVPYLIRMREQAAYVAAGYAEEMQKTPARFSEATMDALEQRAMQACFDPDTSPKNLKILIDLLLRREEQKLKEQANDLKFRRLEFLEKRQKKLEQVFKSRLSNEEVAARCRVIFWQSGTLPPKKENPGVNFPVALTDGPVTPELD